MRTALPIRVLCALLLSCFATRGAFAEVTLSITISGSAEELIPLLRKLERMGIGAPGADTTATEEVMQIELHSVNTETGSGEAAAATVEVEEELGLWGAAVQPSPAKPGDTVVVTVQIADTARKIDTIAVAVEGGEGLGFDLYDNGTNGDEAANDGVWSYALVVPQTLDVDQYKMTIVPYNRRGQDVAVETPEGERIPLKAELVLPIQR